MKTEIDYLNPDGLSKNPAFTQVVTVQAPGKTIYIGGQNAVDAKGQVVGKGDIRLQTEQTLKNIETAVQAGGGKLENIIQWRMYVRKDQDLRPGFEVFQSVWGRRGQPPVITMCFVEGLANPDYLLEMEAVAVIPL